MPEEKVVVNNLYKIFGPKPERAYDLINQGLVKEEIFEKTGLTIGVQDATFSVFSGEIFVVMGLSGSGKSTLVRMLNRLIEPTYGEVIIDGETITKINEKEMIDLRRRKMSMVFQSFALMPHLTVLENAAYGLKVSKVPKNKREERAMESLDQVGLKPYALSYPDELSGGMQQRVGLARALAQDPAIMLMDEAFSALDPLIRAEMQDELIKLQDQSERTVVFISHDLHEAMRIGDRIGVMEGGRIVQVGTPDEILKNPADKYVSSFFRGVDPTTVFSAGDVARDRYPTLFRHKGEGPRAALEYLQERNYEYGYILDRKKHFQGVVSIRSLRDLIESDEKEVEAGFLEGIDPIEASMPLSEVLPIVRRYECPVPVVDENRVYKGALSKNIFLRTLEKSAESE
jgi:glycine betaine/proline transport system ATP-binding protein